MLMRRVRRGLMVVGTLGLSALVVSACSTTRSGPARGSGTTTTVRALVPPHTHHPGTTSSTAATSPSTTAGGAAGSGGSGGMPTLGVAAAWGPSAVGFGQVKPAEISLGGDPTGLVTGITWQSWGESQATGSGTSTFVGPNQSVAQGTQETATVVASDLGTCGGAPAYQQVKWYFPGQGETLSTGANTTINACTGP